MEVNKISKKGCELFSHTWFSWPTDKDRLLLLIKNYIKNYDKKKKTDKITEPDSVDRSYRILPTELKYMTGMLPKDIRLVVKILNRRGNILHTISTLLSDGKDVSVEVKKVEAYNEALKKYLPILNTKETLSHIDLHTASDIEGAIMPSSDEKSTTKGKKSKDEQDRDIVNALNYVGVTIEKDDLGTYSIVKNRNGNGIKYFVGKSEKSFALSKKTCNKYINEFLNKPIESRKFITASQVFADYIREAEESLGVSKASVEDLKKLFGSALTFKDPTVYFKNVIKNYSRHSKNWQTFKKEHEPEEEKKANKVTHNELAKKMVIGSSLSSVVNDNEVLSEEQINNPDYKAGNISKDFGLDIDLNELGDEAKYLEGLEDISFRAISALHSTLQELKSYRGEVTDDLAVDYMKKSKIHRVLDEQRGGYLEKKNDYESQIAKLSKDTSADNSKEIKFYQKQLEKVQDKLNSEEYKKANSDFLSSRNRFRRVLCLSKYYDTLLDTDITLKKERAKLLKKPIPAEEIVASIKGTLSKVVEPTLKIEKGKIELNGVEDKKAIKKQYTLIEIDKEIEKLCSEQYSQDAHAEDINKNPETNPKTESKAELVNEINGDFGDIRGELKKLKVQKDYEKKLRKLDESRIQEEQKQTTGVKLTKEINPEVLEKIADNLSALNTTTPNAGVTQKVPMQNVQTSPIQNVVATPNTVVAQNPQVANVNPQATPVYPQGSNTNSLGLDNDLTRELIELLLEDKKRELERRKGVVFTTAEEETPKADITFTQASAPAKGDDIFSQMLGYEGDAETTDIDSLDIEDEIPNSEEEASSQKATNIDIFPVDTNYVNMPDNDMGGVEPSIIPYLVAYQKDGVNVYGNSLEAFATYERYSYLVETKGNLLNTYIANKMESKATADDIISDLKCRALKVSLGRSNVKLDDGVISSIDLSKNIASALERHIDKTASSLVASDFDEIMGSIDFDLLKIIIENRINGDVDSGLPENIRDGLETALNMLGSLAKIITGDSKTARNYEKYSGKMRQNYVDTLIGKLESKELPMVQLDSDAIYSRMLDYLSFSISAQNVIIDKNDSNDGGLTSYPRNIYFGQKELADEILRSGRTLSYEQNLLLTKRNSALFDELDNDVTNLFGTLYPFNGANNKILLRIKPNPLKGGVKFMENMVDALRLDYSASATKKAESKVAENIVVSDDMQPSDYEDDDWFLRKRFLVSKEKAKEYALQLAFGKRYGIDPNKTKLKEDFYDNNMLSLQKINNFFKGLDENTISMITSVIRSIMTQRVDRYEDFVEKLDKQFLIYANKMLYIVEEIDMISDFESRYPEEKRSAIDKLEGDFIAKSEDNSEVHPELTSPRKMINVYMNSFRFYALTQMMSVFEKDERIVSKEFIKEFDEVKKNMRTYLIDKIKDSARLSGYEIETARYFELDIVVDENSRDNVEFVDASEATNHNSKPVGADIHNIDIIYAGIRQGFYGALDSKDDALLKEDMKGIAEVLDIVGNISEDADVSTFEIKLPIGQTIRCNIKGLLQQYIFRTIMNRGEETESFDYIINELKNTQHLGEIAKDIKDVALDLSSEELGVNLIMQFSTLSDDGTYLELGETISTVLEGLKSAKTVEDVYSKLNNDSFYKSAVSNIKDMFTKFFDRKKSEQIVF